MISQKPHGNNGKIHSMQSRKNMSEGTILYRQVRSEIKLLSFQSEFKFEIKQLNEMITGLLLSDAHLTKNRKNNHNSMFVIEQKYTRKQFLDVIKLEFEKFKINCKLEKVIHKGNDSTHKRDTMSYVMRTEAHPYLTILRDEWYKNNRKIIPKDIDFTSKIMAFWFMGDGSSQWIGAKKDLTRISLYTNSFRIDECKRLILLLSNFGISSGLLKIRKNQYIIGLSKSIEVRKFFDLIKPHMIKCFSYKIKYPRYASKSKNEKGRFT